MQILEEAERLEEKYFDVSLVAIPLIPLSLFRGFFAWPISDLYFVTICLPIFLVASLLRNSARQKKSFVYGLIVIFSYLSSMLIHPMTLTTQLETFRIFSSTFGGVMLFFTAARWPKLSKNILIICAIILILTNLFYFFFEGIKFVADPYDTKNRAYLGFTDPNHLGLLFGMFLFSYPYLIKQRSVLIILVISTTVAFALTGSRSALLAFIFVLLIQNRSFIKCMISKYFLMFTFASFVFITYIFRLISNKPFSLTEASSAERYKLALKSVEAIIRHPFDGIGPGNIVAWGDALGSSHSTYLLVLAELGIPLGVCTFFALMKLLSKLLGSTPSLLKWNLLFIVAIQAIVLDIQTARWLYIIFGTLGGYFLSQRVTDSHVFSIIQRQKGKEN